MATRRTSKSASRKPAKKSAKPAKKSAKPAKKRATTAAPARKPAKAAAKVVKKRAVAKKRAPPAKPATPATRLPVLPFLWRYDTSEQAVGLWVDEHVWAANEIGEVFQLTREGELLRSFKLPKGVGCLFSDDAWKFAGCNDGNVYDLTGRVPRAMYKIKTNMQIDWLEGYRGNLVVSDHRGGLTVLDAEGNLQWEKKDAKAREGWMVRADGTGIYHGTSTGLRKYDWQGEVVWKSKLDEARFGFPAGENLVVMRGFNKHNKSWLHLIDKATGEELAVSKEPIVAPDNEESHGGAESCASAFDKSGALRMFGSAADFLFCLDDKGERIWDAPTDMGSACTMQAIDDRLYIVTSTGVIACIDISDEAIAKAWQGQAPKTRREKAAKVADAETQIERTSDTSKGVVVECHKDGSKLRVRVVSDGYHADWHVQFPRDLRQEGARFVVDEVREATQGGFYRVLGDIKRLDD